MKICYLSPNPNIGDGIAAYSLALCDELKKDNEISMITSKNGGKGDIPYLLPLLSFNPYDFIQLISWINNHKIQILHVQYAIPAYGILSLHIWLIVLIYKFIFKVKVIVTLHEVKRETDLLGAISKLYFFLISLVANVVLVHTSEAKTILEEKCSVNSEKTRIMKHFIFDAPYIRKKAKKDSINILFFGYIHVDKGIDFLIQALNILKTEKLIKKELKLLIAGQIRLRSGIFKIFEKKDQEYLEGLRKLILEYDLVNDVSFLGYIPAVELYECLGEADVIVLPYTNAEQSGVLHRILPMRIPIIATRIGGLAETLNDYGLLVPPFDPNSIAEKIVWLFNDKKNHSRIANSYDKLMNELSLKQIALLHNNLYKELI